MRERDPGVLSATGSDWCEECLCWNRWQNSPCERGGRCWEVVAAGERYGLGKVWVELQMRAGGSVCREHIGVIGREESEGLGRVCREWVGSRRPPMGKDCSKLFAIRPELSPLLYFSIIFLPS